MSLIQCPECKKKISEIADSCPNCGYKFARGETSDIKRKEKKITGISILIVSVIFGYFGVRFLIYDANKIPTPKTKEEIRQEQLSTQFSSWNGSHRGLTEYIKQSMNDPSSYEHVDTRYWDKGDFLIVETTFRGKNAFGGVVKNTITAKVDMNGNILEIYPQNP